MQCVFCILKSDIIDPQKQWTILQQLQNTEFPRECPYYCLPSAGRRNQIQHAFPRGSLRLVVTLGDKHDTPFAREISEISLRGADVIAPPGGVAQDVRRRKAGDKER